MPKCSVSSDVLCWKDFEVLKILVLEGMNEFTTYILEIIKAYVMDKALHVTTGNVCPGVIRNG